MQVRATTAPDVLAGRAFDRLARDYDERFTRGELGRLLRARVWARLDARFPRGGRILDLGCGTGEDAVYLASEGMRVVALDASRAMVDAARRKVEAARLEDRISVQYATIESLADSGTRRTDETARSAVFHGAFSNFGALNCSAVDYASLARGLATLLGPGAPLILVVMGPAVPWEWAWYLTRGEPRTAFRRLRGGGAVWRNVVVRYPSIRTVRRAFAPWFHYRRASALGCLLPPGYAASWLLPHPRLLRALDHCERLLATAPPLPWLADHYVLELERR
jgi:SAM-dependent methyltransferase